MTDLETRALRDPRLRRHHAIVVFMFHAPSMSIDTPKPIKVRRTGAYLKIHHVTVRLALALLVRLGYLVRTSPRNAGAPGEYCLPTGSHGDPVRGPIALPTASVPG